MTPYWRLSQIFAWVLTRDEGFAEACTNIPHALIGSLRVGVVVGPWKIEPVTRKIVRQKFDKTGDAVPGSQTEEKYTDQPPPSLVELTKAVIGAHQSELIELLRIDSPDPLPRAMPDRMGFTVESGIVVIEGYRDLRALKEAVVKAFPRAVRLRSIDRVSMGQLAKWYREVHVPARQLEGHQCSIADDQAAANVAFPGMRVSRNNLRAARAEHAPATWRAYSKPAGRRLK